MGPQDGVSWITRALYSSWLFSTACLAQQYPRPGECLGACDNVQDISVIQDQSGKYYRFSGHNGIAIATSPSLIGPWMNATPAFPHWKSDLANLKTNLQDLWAPDVRLIDGLYYLYFTVENFGTDLYGFGDAASARYGATAVATSKSLDGGTWQTKGTLHIPDDGDEYTRFDTSIVPDGDGYFISFGSYSKGLFGMPLQSPPVQVVQTDSTMLVADEPVPGQTRNRSEGSYLYKNGDHFYLFYGSGDCCPGIHLPANEEYKIKYCRAKRPEGPYYDRDGSSCLGGQGGTLLLPSHGDRVYAPGSPSILEDTMHGRVLVYQYMDPTIGLSEENIRMGWNPLDFEDGWPVLRAASVPIGEPRVLKPNSGESSSSGSASTTNDKSSSPSDEPHTSSGTLSAHVKASGLVAVSAFMVVMAFFGQAVPFLQM